MADQPPAIPEIVLPESYYIRRRARAELLSARASDEAGLYTSQWFRQSQYHAAALSGGGLINPGSGMGGISDKTGNVSFIPTRINNCQPLETIYAESWAARKTIEIPVSDMLIRWRTLQHPDPQLVETFEEAEKRHRIRSWLRRAAIAGRLYGTALLLIITSEAPLDEPLDVDRLRPGDLRSLILKDRFHVSVEEKDHDIFSPHYDQPLIYRAEIDHASKAKLDIHHSRVLRFDGMAPPDSHGWSAYDQDWGLSELIGVMTSIFQDASLAAGGSHMVSEFSIPVVKMKNYHQAIAAEAHVDPEIPTAAQIAENVNMAKSIYRTMFIDQEDDVDRLAVNVSGLANLMDRYARRVAAAADIPATRFWGQSPVGMNATGASDMANYAIRVAELQRDVLDDPLGVLDMILARTSGLAEPPTYKWIPLIDLSETDQAQILSTRTDALIKAMREGLIDAQAAHEVIAGDPAFAEIDVDFAQAQAEREDRRDQALEMARSRSPSSGPPAPPGQVQDAGGRHATRQQRLIIRAINDDGARMVADFGGELAGLFEALGQRAADAFDEAREITHLLDAAEPTVDPLAERTLRRMDLDAFLDDDLIPAFDNFWGRAVPSTLDAINGASSLTVNLPDPVMRQVVAQGGRRVGLLDIQGESRQAVFRALADGRALGEGPFDLRDRIKDQVGAGRFIHAGPRYRAELIARTETKYSQNVASIEAYERSPVVTGLRAFDAQLGPERSDPECIARDGTIYSFGAARRETEEEHPAGTLNWAPHISPIGSQSTPAQIVESPPEVTATG